VLLDTQMQGSKIPTGVYGVCVSLNKVKVKGKVHPRTSHPGLEGAHDGVDGQNHAPTVLPPGYIRYPFYRRLGGPQKLSGQVRKILL
jgi:hypothetical protein